MCAFLHITWMGGPCVSRLWAQKGFAACPKHWGDGGGARLLRLGILWYTCMRTVTAATVISAAVFLHNLDLALKLLPCWFSVDKVNRLVID